MHEFIRSRDQVVVKKRVLTCKHGVVFSLSSLKTPTHNSTSGDEDEAIAVISTTALVFIEEFPVQSFRVQRFRGSTC